MQETAPQLLEVARPAPASALPRPRTRPGRKRIEWATVEAHVRSARAASLNSSCASKTGVTSGEHPLPQVTPAEPQVLVIAPAVGADGPPLECAMPDSATPRRPMMDSVGVLSDLHTTSVVPNEGYHDNDGNGNDSEAMPVSILQVRALWLLRHCSQSSWRNNLRCLSCTQHRLPWHVPRRALESPSLVFNDKVGISCLRKTPLPVRHLVRHQASLLRPVKPPRRQQRCLFSKRFSFQDISACPPACDERGPSPADITHGGGSQRDVVQDARSTVGVESSPLRAPRSAEAHSSQAQTSGISKAESFSHSAAFIVLELVFFPIAESCHIPIPQPTILHVTWPPFRSQSHLINAGDASWRPRQAWGSDETRSVWRTQKMPRRDQYSTDAEFETAWGRWRDVRDSNNDSVSGTSPPPPSLLFTLPFLSSSSWHHPSSPKASPWFTIGSMF